MSETISGVQVRLFDALCDLVIYHHCDLRRPEKVGEESFSLSVELLVSKGIIESQEDPGDVWGAYDGMVEDFALSALPDDFHPGHDFYGAKVITNATNGVSLGGPSEVFFAGDDSGHYMYFDYFESMLDYTNGVIG